MGIELLIELFKDEIKINESMALHTTFKTGGTTSILFEPSTTDNLLKGLEIINANKVKYVIIGKGSNVLFRDGNFNGVVIKIAKKFTDFKIENDILEVGSGMTLMELSNKALQNEYEGLEFAFGIPGTIGGAIAMNAGAYDSEIKNILLDATVIDGDKIVVLSNKDLELTYRNSIIFKKNLIVIKSRFKLKKCNKKTIQNRMDSLKLMRNEKQPLDKPSAGSTFKRPLNNYAGKLIMEAGLSGFTIGGASVSNKHCGFIVNNGDATSTDIINLINYVIEEVEKKSKITLEKEIKIF